MIIPKTHLAPGQNLLHAEAGGSILLLLPLIAVGHRILLDG